MSRVLKATVLAAAVVLLFSGCVTHEHVVGAGPQGSASVTAQQWYVLWGLVPINEVDTRMMAEGAEDYRITTEYDFLDIVINAFANSVTVTTRTVTVTR